MSAPPKPWENSGAGDSRTFQMPATVDQNLVGQVPGAHASQPTSLLGPVPTAGQPRRRPPPAPATNAAARTQSYGAPLTANGAAYPGAYGSTYGGAYGGAYSGGLGTYGSSLGTYGSSLGTYGSSLGTYGSSLGTYGSSLGTYGSSLGSYGMGTYGGGLGSYGSSYGSPYGGYGMGTGYGSYGQRLGYGPGAPGTAESRLVALAAERSRPAFESIESVVQTVGSVSFMLESTLGALHSSFRAVLAVADHLGRLRAIFSAMAVFRVARMLYTKLMQMLGVAPPHRAEAAWAAVAPDPAPSGASWPVAAFVAVVVAAPYLAFRLLARLAPSEPSPAPAHAPANELPAWLASGAPVWRATSRYDFAPEAPGELPLRANQAVFLAPQRMQSLHDGWVLASDGNASGLVPKAYIGDVAQVTAPANRGSPRGPVMPTFTPDAAEPVISPTRHDGQPDKPTE